MAVTEMRCPFPPCSASWWTKETMVPAHAINSDFTIGGQQECPGASAMYLSVDNRRNIDDLTPATRADVLRAWRAYQEAEADQRKRNEVMPTDPASRFQGWPLGTRPHGVDPTAFPPRAGDPGAPDQDWKPRPKILPIDQAGYPLGRAAVSNAHATTRQLLSLTEQKLDEAVAALGKLPDIADTLDGIVTQVAIHIDAAAALATATVGSGDDAPAAAGEMVGFIRDAQGKASVENGGELPAALVRFVYQATQITQMISAAQERARQYHSALGGGS